MLNKICMNSNSVTNNIHNFNFKMESVKDSMPVSEVVAGSMGRRKRLRRTDSSPTKRPKRPENTWIRFVKERAVQSGRKFSVVLQDPDVRQAYRSSRAS